MLRLRQKKIGKGIFVGIPILILFFFIGYYGGRFKHSLFVDYVERDGGALYKGNKIVTGGAQDTPISINPIDIEATPNKSRARFGVVEKEVSMTDELEQRPLNLVLDVDTERIIRNYVDIVDRISSQVEISSDDVAQFKAAFNQIPAQNKVACLNRLLNLIPNTHSCILRELLFDQDLNNEVVSRVFQDLVNRPDAVKKPLMEMILQNPSHPCYSDAQWIYEVTGENPDISDLK